MIGSETFIIVAFMCREKRTSLALASAICSARNASSFARRMTAESTISPSWTASCSLRTVTAPSAPTCSMRSVSAFGIVSDVSVDRKSPSSIVATCDRESFDQAPIEWG
jgi:hypothetical protein